MRITKRTRMKPGTAVLFRYDRFFLMKTKSITYRCDILPFGLGCKHGPRMGEVSHVVRRFGAVLKGYSGRFPRGTGQQDDMKGALTYTFDMCLLCRLHG